MNSPGLSFRLTTIGFVAACLALGLWLRAGYAPEWRLPDSTQNPPALRPWAIEADCYSQLARVDRILHGQGLLQNHFTVENWPEGLDPSTTAPFDYVILLLDLPLRLVTTHPLEWAGALVSPLLWVGLIAFWLLAPLRTFNRWGRTLLIAGSATLPAIIQATEFGRPRHQSLILVLIAVALTAEYERWRDDLPARRGWHLLAGAAWGLACWTSLFEPVVIGGALLLFNLATRRRENAAFLGALALVLAAMSLLEGGHIFGNVYRIAHLPPELRAAALNWLNTISEVLPIDFNGLVLRLTAIWLALPFLAWAVWPRDKAPLTDAFLVLATFSLLAFTAAQNRWSYYAALALLFILVRFVQAAPREPTRLSVLVLLAVALIYTNHERLVLAAGAPRNLPSLELAQVSTAIDAPGGILAPWWLSPGLLYFSGQPIVAGSSHCGMSGIVDSARFFTATSWPEAEAILKQRQVRWIVAWDDRRYQFPLLNASRGILGEPQATDENPGDAENTVAQQLCENGAHLPPEFHLRDVAGQSSERLKLYEFVPDGP